MSPRNITWSDLTQAFPKRKREREGNPKRETDTCCFVRKNPQPRAHQALVNNSALVYLNAPDRSRMPRAGFSRRFRREKRSRACVRVRVHALICSVSKKGRRTPAESPELLAAPFALSDVEFHAFRAATREKWGNRDRRGW